MPFGQHHRGYLPHVDFAQMCQSITFRLADAVPTAIVQRWVAELKDAPDALRAAELRGRMDSYEDAGHGCCVLRRADCAGVVIDLLRQGDGTDYQLHAWAVMPNHVHVLVGPLDEQRRYDVSDITRRWKGASSRRINQQIGSRGRLWLPESWDRWIRDERHFARVRAYIEENPVKAGLVDWPWVSGPGSAGFSLPAGGQAG